MERVISQYMLCETPYCNPYINNYGYGDGIGVGDSNGCGVGYTNYVKSNNWNGSSIKYFNGHKTYFINGYVLYITHVHKPYAIGEIINNDLTTQRCYILKLGETFIIGESIKDIIENARKHISKSFNLFKDIADAFILAHPEYEKEYDWDEMVAWHSLDPSSCADGRRNFSIIANKKSGDVGTPKELISYMKDSSSKEIAFELEKNYLLHKLV